MKPILPNGIFHQRRFVGTSIGGKRNIKIGTNIARIGIYQASSKKEETITIGFEKGEIVGVNNVHYTDKIAAINKVEELGSVGIG